MSPGCCARDASYRSVTVIITEVGYKPLALGEDYFPWKGEHRLQYSNFFRRQRYLIKLSDCQVYFQINKAHIFYFPFTVCIVIV